MVEACAWQVCALHNLDLSGKSRSKNWEGLQKMGKTINFTVDGAPVAKGRPRFARRGKFISTYTPSKTRSYEEKVGIEAALSMCGLQPLQGPLKCKIDMYMQIPKRATNTHNAAI